MNLKEQICFARQYVPELMQYFKARLAYEHRKGFEEAAELWLPVYDDNDEMVGLERISDFSEGIS